MKLILFLVLTAAALPTRASSHLTSKVWNLTCSTDRLGLDLLGKYTNYLAQSFPVKVSFHGDSDSGLFAVFYDVIQTKGYLQKTQTQRVLNLAVPAKMNKAGNSVTINVVSTVMVLNLTNIGRYYGYLYDEDTFKPDPVIGTCGLEPYLKDPSLEKTGP